MTLSILNKQVCASCANKYRTSLLENNQKREVVKLPWTNADDKLWEKGIVICYNNIAIENNQAPEWCPNESIHISLNNQKNQPKTPELLEISFDDEEVNDNIYDDQNTFISEQSDNNKNKNQSKTRQKDKGEHKFKEIDDQDDLINLLGD